MTGRTLTLDRPIGSIQYVGLSPAPGGRLWVWWVEGSTVYATRTNPPVTRLGAVRSLKGPGGASPTRTAGDGSDGPLDVVVNAAPGYAASAMYAARVLPGLSLRVSPASVPSARGGTVSVTVTDAGVPVPGARVRVGAVTGTTNAAGRASVRVAAGTPRGGRAVSATAAGFFPGAGSVRVR